MMARFLPSLFETKHADPKDAVARAVQVSANGYYTSSVTQGFQLNSWDLHQAVRKGYERLITVFRCVDAIAQNAASLEQYVSKGATRDGLRVPDPYIDYVLNRRANRYETSWMFRYRLSSQLLLSRKGAFVERVNNRSGRPVQLHLMDPANVTPIKDPRLYVSGYKVRGVDHREYTLDPDQVIWLRLKPHPTDPYAQMTPMVAAGLTADTEYLSRIYNRSVVANNGRPGMLITIGTSQAGGINREDAEELKRVFGNNPNVAGETHVVEADNMNVQDLQATPQELQYLAGLDATANDIYLAFGTPKSVLGDASGRTFANADAERLNWWMDTMQAHCDGITSAWDILTEGGLEDDLFVANDYDQVDVLQKAKQDKHDRLLNDFNSGVITLDEYLRGTGRIPLDVPASRVVYVMAPGKLPIGKNEQDAQTVIEMLGQLAVPGPTPAGQSNGFSPQQLSEFARQGALKGWQQGQQQLADDTAARALAIAGKALDLVGGKETKEIGLSVETKSIEDDDERWDEVEVPNTAGTRTIVLTQRKDYPYTELRTSVEAEMHGLLSAWNNRQATVVSERLMGTKARKGTRHWSDDGVEIKESERIAKLRAPKKCKFCSKPASKVILHSEGMGYIATCPDHFDHAQGEAETCTPDGTRDPSNINKVYDVATKALDTGYLVDSAKWADEIASDFRPTLEKVVDRQFSRTMKQLDKDGILGTYNSQGGGNPSGRTLADRVFGNTELGQSAAKQAMVNQIMGIVRQSAKNQSERLALKIQKMDNDGASIHQIKDVIANHSSKSASWKRSLATYATTALIEGAQDAVLNPMGDLIDRQWNSHHDEKTRFDHLEADGQVVHGKQLFEVGDAMMLYPCDPAAPIHETANCRCWSTFGRHKDDVR